MTKNKPISRMSWQLIIRPVRCTLYTYAIIYAIPRARKK